MQGTPVSDPLVAQLKEVPYYDVGGITVLDVMKSKMTPEQYRGYLLGNVIKYSLRLNWKHHSKDDAKKLADYAKWLEETYVT
jgi:hypothetical protein